MDLASLMITIQMLNFLIFAHDLVMPQPPPVVQQQVQLPPIEQTTVEIVYKDAIIE